MRKRKLVHFIDDEIDLSSDGSDYLESNYRSLIPNDVRF